MQDLHSMSQIVVRDIAIVASNCAQEATQDRLWQPQLHRHTAEDEHIILHTQKNTDVKPQSRSIQEPPLSPPDLQVVSDVMGHTGTPIQWLTAV